MCIETDLRCLVRRILRRCAIATLKLDLHTVARGTGWKLAVLEQRSRHDNAHLSRIDPCNLERLATLEPSDAATQAWLGTGFSEDDVLPPWRGIVRRLKLGNHLDYMLTIGRWKRTNALDARITTGEEGDRDNQKRAFHGQCSIHLTRIRPNFWAFQEKYPKFGSNPA
jgi:hypothetical protein